MGLSIILSLFLYPGNFEPRHSYKLYPYKLGLTPVAHPFLCSVHDYAYPYPVVIMMCLQRVSPLNHHMHSVIAPEYSLDAPECCLYAHTIIQFKSAKIGKDEANDSKREFSALSENRIRFSVAIAILTLWCNL